MSVEDSDRNIHFDSSFTVIGNDKGWRMSRANVFAREGQLYYEVRILKGVPAEATGHESLATPQPHVRVGWARREAPLDAPVGFDAYSYGITDSRLDTMHRSRPGKFIPPSKSSSKSAKQLPSTPTPSHIRTGDTIGLLLTLPPLPLHRKVVAGTYNPAVDFSSAPDPSAPPVDILRDRIPLLYRGAAYFESSEYQPSRAVLAWADRAPSTIVIDRPHPNHDEPSMRTLPGSSVAAWINGVRVDGNAFEELLAFLPPASAPAQTGQAGARQGLDDGALGYYPAVSVFGGGMAEVNLGPKFRFPPTELGLGDGQEGGDVEMAEAQGDAVDGEDEEVRKIMKPRAISERYAEQIAEDVVWDIIDEASFFVADGAYDFEGDQLLLVPKGN
jgi:COMPASS component BRE2